MQVMQPVRDPFLVWLWWSPAQTCSCVPALRHAEAASTCSSTICRRRRSTVSLLRASRALASLRSASSTASAAATTPCQHQQQHARTHEFTRQSGMEL